MEYSEYVESKVKRTPAYGSEPGDVHPLLFDFQSAIVKWAIRRGRAAIFADCGLGKTLMQLEWARQSGDRLLIVAPLAVAEQTIAEASKIDLEARKVERPDDGPGIQITNYEKLRHFVGAPYDGIVLDESSILKSLDGKTRTMLLREFTGIPRRLCCTATPAPNDLSELANHAEFLGVMSRVEMLASFFVHDSENSGDAGWRLKGHAQDAFWKWVAQWAVYVRSPSDLGFDNGAFELPELSIRQETVVSNWKPEGMLFAAGIGGIGDRRKARRSTIDARVARAVEIIRGGDGQWLVWCGLNDEGDELETRVDSPNCIQVAGSDCDEKKLDAMLWFTGKKCICDAPWFGYKLAACGSGNTATTENEKQRKIRNTPEGASHKDQEPRKRTSATCERTISPTSTSGDAEPKSSEFTTTPTEGQSTPRTHPSAMNSSERCQNISDPIPTSGSTRGCEGMELRPPNTEKFYGIKVAGVPSAAPAKQTSGDTGSTSIIATSREPSGDCSALTATWGSESFETTPQRLSERPCTCGHVSGKRTLISKAKLYGFGVNIQTCHNVIYLGMDDSYERFYQSVRRCWRFGQKNPVNVVIVTSDAEQCVADNVRRKEADAATLAEGIVAHVKDAMRVEVVGGDKAPTTYDPRIEMKLPGFLKGPSTCAA